MLRAVRSIAWLGAGALAVLLLTQPVSVQAQLSLGLATIFCMICVWRFGRGATARQLFLALGTFIVLRYVYWRLTSTLPSPGDPVSFGLGLLLLFAELYCVLILTISLIINADPLKREPPPTQNECDLPTVDVFIPSYNEEQNILAVTIAAAKSMDYPTEKLNVWLLDDGGTDQKCADSDPDKAESARRRRASLQALCADFGAIYHTRARNEHAKAGNMNDALKHARGAIVVVFDADHAPFRSFLRETIGYFAQDSKLFLVQTPHVFINPDPIEKNLRTFDRMPSENEMFYSVTQKGLDKWNGSFFCGSAALLRRSALDTTGGFSGITITEDCETAFELHSQGWTSVYVEKPLIAGLQPETFASFIGQRSRWCQGMFQILLLKNPAFKRGLSLVQKLCYLSSMTFWFFPLPRLIFMFAPLTHIFFNVKIFVSNVDEAIAYTGVYIVVNIMLQNYLYGAVRWPWISELYEYLQGVFLVKAIVAVALRPRRPTFKVTAKGLTLDRDHLSELAWPFFAIYALLVLGALVAIWRYLFEPGVGNLMIVVGLWNGFNLLIAGTALGAVAERKQTRRHARLQINRPGALDFGDKVVPVTLLDISAGGCAVRPEGELPTWIGQEHQNVRLRFAPLGGRMAEGESLPVIIRRARATPGGILHGLEFDELSAQEYFALADLMYGDSDALPKFLARRRKHKSVFAGSAQFVWWGFTEPVRAISLALRGARQDARLPTPLPPVSETPTIGLRRLVSVAKLRDGAGGSSRDRRAA